MSNHPPHSHDSKAKADETPRPPTSDEQLKAFWIKNEKSVYIGFLVLLAVVAGVGVFRYLQKESANKIGAEYAAATTPEKLRSFIAANPDHILARTAELRIADEAYQAKKYSDAATAYEKAAADKNTPFAGRAQLGAAMSKILAGQTADGVARLKNISNDSTQTAILRGEATYHLATLASSAGQTAEALKLYEQVSEIAPATPWADNAAFQRERLSAAVSTPAIPATQSAPSVGLPGIQLPQ